MLKIVTKKELEKGDLDNPLALISIDETHFAVMITEDASGCTWKLDSIRRLTDEEMKAEDLYCRYRYHEHVIKAPEGYDGAMEIDAGFNLRDESSYYSKNRDTYCEKDGWHNYLLSI